jgi:hypothetical protein
MASITPVKNSEKWHARICKAGERMSKTCLTKRDAELWADHHEQRLSGRERARALAQNANPHEALLVSGIPSQVLDAMEKVPYNMQTVLAASMPCKQASGIYFLIAAGEVMYVGQSINIFHRIARHIRDGRRFDAVSFISCLPESMNELEGLYIAAMVPRWNVSFGPKLLCDDARKL